LYRPPFDAREPALGCGGNSSADDSLRPPEHHQCIKPLLKLRQLRLFTLRVASVSNLSNPELGFIMRFRAVLWPRTAGAGMPGAKIIWIRLHGRGIPAVKAAVHKLA
jgi:hypothetical protein